MFVLIIDPTCFGLSC